MRISLFLILPAAVLPTAAARRHEPSPLSIPWRKSVRAYHVSSGRWMAAFGNPQYFTNKYVPSDKPGAVLKVPNFDVLFGEICKVSPLAKQAFEDDSPGGIKAIGNAADVYKWKTTDSNPKRLVSHIDKIDNYQKHGVPLLRFRSTLHGPTKKRGECFSELVSVTNLRTQWDAANAMVDTIYSAADMKEIEKLQEFKYGEPTLFGIGYVKTKQSVVSPREQMTLCGVQNFPSGASIIWGTELEEDQDHLFPEGKRVPRSTSYLFSVAIIPTAEETFDVEYCLQLEIGSFPGWLTGPAVAETIKKLFSFADGYFKSGLVEGGDLAKRLALFPDDVEVTDSGESLQSNEIESSVLDQKQTLLMPP